MQYYHFFWFVFYPLYIQQSHINTFASHHLLLLQQTSSRTDTFIFTSTACSTATLLFLLSSARWVSAHCEHTDCTKGHRVHMFNSVPTRASTTKRWFFSSFHFFQCVLGKCNMMCSYTFIDSMEKLKSCWGLCKDKWLVGSCVVQCLFFFSTSPVSEFRCRPELLIGLVACYLLVAFNGSWRSTYLSNFFFFFFAFTSCISRSSMKRIKVSKAELCLDVHCIITKGFWEPGGYASLFLSDCILQLKARHLCRIIPELHPKKNLKLTINSDQACSSESHPMGLGGALAVIECGQ